MTSGVPAEVDAYLGELRRRAEATAESVGVYAGGSYALGGYEHGRSDLDVAVVTPGPVAPAVKERLVDLLRHESLPCPARGLELVVYSLPAAAAVDVAPAFELNLNSGAGMDFRLDRAPDPAEGHWFAIDRAILRRHGVALSGPAPDLVFGPIPRRSLLAVLADSLRWHAMEGASPEEAVLNACRALRFALTDEWSSKASAGVWALDHVADRGIVRAALAARSGGETPAADEARAFVDGVLARLAQTSR